MQACDKQRGICTGPEALDAVIALAERQLEAPSEPYRRIDAGQNNLYKCFITPSRAQTLQNERGMSFGTPIAGTPVATSTAQSFATPKPIQFHGVLPVLTVRGRQIRLQNAFGVNR